MNLQYEDTEIKLKNYLFGSSVLTNKKSQKAHSLLLPKIDSESNAISS